MKLDTYWNDKDASNGWWDFYLKGLRKATVVKHNDQYRLHTAFHSNELDKVILAAASIEEAKKEVERLLIAYYKRQQIMHIEEEIRCAQIIDALCEDPYAVYLPDNISIAEMEAYGYKHAPENRMLPISAPVALELYRLEAEIFRLYSDDTEGLVENETEIIEHNGLFGIEAKSWASVRRYHMNTVFDRANSVISEEVEE